MIGGGKAPVFIAIPERHFSIDAFADVKSVRIVFGCCKHNLGFGHVSGVEVDPASRTVP